MLNAPTEREIAPAVIAAVQAHFHAVIVGRASELLDEFPVPLPMLQSPYPTAESKAWFRVPGMYGGFSYWFDLTGEQPKLISESWCRIVDGSAERHEITAEGSKLAKKERVWLELCDGSQDLPPGQRRYVLRSDF